MIYERLSPQLNSESFKRDTQSHLEEFATQGLRTLCCAVADISNQTYEVTPVYNWFIRTYCAVICILINSVFNRSGNRFIIKLPQPFTTAN